MPTPKKGETSTCQMIHKPLLRYTLHLPPEHLKPHHLYSHKDNGKIKLRQEKTQRSFSRLTKKQSNDTVLCVNKPILPSPSAGRGANFFDWNGFPQIQLTARSNCLWAETGNQWSLSLIPPLGRLTRYNHNDNWPISANKQSIHIIKRYIISKNWREHFDTLFQHP